MQDARMQTKCAIAMVVVLLAAPGLARAACGDGVVDGDEQCDGADLAGETCTTLTAGFAQGGTLACKADCTFDTTDCRRAFVETLIPARGAKNRCQLEWAVPGTTAVRGAAIKRACNDGFSECDADSSFDNACSFRVQFCLNVPDPKVAGCPYIDQPELAKVFRVEVLQPRSGEVTTSLVAAAAKLATDTGLSANTSGTAVSFNPPVTTFACGGTTIRVPLKGTTGHARPGKVKLKMKSSDNSGRVKAIGALTLVCNP
jgi:hypothetical protein